MQGLVKLEGEACGFAVSLTGKGVDVTRVKQEGDFLWQVQQSKVGDVGRCFAC